MGERCFEGGEGIGRRAVFLSQAISDQRVLRDRSTGLEHHTADCSKAGKTRDTSTRIAWSRHPWGCMPFCSCIFVS